jgi:cGMP-dependent protein kinase 2
VTADFLIAIVGSGPAGMSAAAHAAKLGQTHILLERTGHFNDTIFKYQKRKLVMATPEILPLRSELGFKESIREELIDGWTGGVEQAQVNFRLNAEVAAIKGEHGNFELTLGNGEKLTAENVVLSIGVQGNLRKLTIPGADAPFVQYQLDDPDEYRGEEIVVIGTGDAGIENALALSVANNVTIINRVTDYPYAKPANAALIQGQINKGNIQSFTNAEPNRLEGNELVVDTPDGEARVKCDRIIARIGALPPRKFVESCGIQFPSDSPTAYPQVSETYEPQIPGLYIVGALAGYPALPQPGVRGRRVHPRPRHSTRRRAAHPGEARPVAHQHVGFRAAGRRARDPAALQLAHHPADPRISHPFPAASAEAGRYHLPAQRLHQLALFGAAGRGRHRDRPGEAE